VRRQRSFLESRVHQIFSVQMHTHLLKKIITVDYCNDVTGNKVDDDGNDATGYDDDDFNRRRIRRQQRSQ
jgi:flavin reductase (DIM6/NTAB) family NADH-FMN oxidoreductase RutF